MSRPAQGWATVAMATAALLFGVMATLVKSACARLPSTEVAFLRFVFGLAAVGVAVLCGRRLRPRSPRALFMRGLFGGGAVLLYFLAIAHLPVGVATVLNYSSPIFTVLFSAIFLREPVTLRSALALGLSLGGVGLLTLGGEARLQLSPAPPHGERAYLLLGVLSALFSGAAVTTIRAMRRGRSAGKSGAGAHADEGSWEIFTAFCLVGAALTGPPCALAFVPPTAREWLLLCGVGLSSVVAQILMTHALRDLESQAGVLLLQGTPLCTFALGRWFLDERPSPLSLVGAALIVVGIVVGLLRAPGRRLPKAGKHAQMTRASQ